MSGSLALAAPAVAAGLAYLNAKSGLWYDYTLMRGTLMAGWHSTQREKHDTVSTFYRLESRATSKATSDQIYLMCEDRTWTYAQTYEMALKYGNWFQTKYGIKKGDVVAMNLQNSDHYVLLCFGLWSIGAKPAFINYNLTGKALTHCVKAVAAALMLVDPELEKNIDEELRSSLPGLAIEFLSEDIVSEVRGSSAERPPDSLRRGQLPRDTAILIFTSGTTGLPKAAIVSWLKLTVAGTFATGWLATRQKDIFYTCMPLYHSSATIMGFTHILEAGATIAIGKKFSTKTFWKDVRRFDATTIQYVGETLRYLLAAPPEIDPVTGENMDKKHNVQSAFGNGLRPDVWEKFRERFGINKISEFYSATEGFYATWNTTYNAFSAGAIGRNGWLYEKIIKSRISIIDVDPDTAEIRRDAKTGLSRQVPRGEVGEMMVIINDMKDYKAQYQGYYKNEKATVSKIVRDVLKKGDAYFRTGDLVRWDKEGRMYFHDRIGDTFRWKSENVATTEVSQMLGMHPSVQEANVYGVQLPNHDGRAGCVALVLKDQPNDATMRSLAQHNKKMLPKYAVPIFLRVVKDGGISITGTLKHQKQDLRSEGVEPSKIGDDELWWLKGDTYVRFGQKDWQELNGGRVKL
ncbi:putative NRPS-like protein biosynthetic cluster [Pestalotiopsis sp. 9143b]|nr:putative NRPS-like protein biosynthetic cluster [Pestalotiopsis sp. 9143b]